MGTEIVYLSGFEINNKTTHHNNNRINEFDKKIRVHEKHWQWHISKIGFEVFKKSGLEMYIFPSSCLIKADAINISSKKEV